MVAPSIRTGNIFDQHPKCSILPAITKTRSWVKPCPAIRFSELAITAFWEITTPFDLPVVPVVYRQKSEDQD